MELPGLRTWIVFYLLSFVVILWAAFLSSQGVMLWVSLMLAIVVVGVNFVTVYNEVKKHASRKKLLHDLTKNISGKAAEVDDRKKRG